MDDYTPKVGYSTETEIEWRQRLDHRLNNIERLLFHLRDYARHYGNLTFDSFYEDHKETHGPKR